MVKHEISVHVIVHIRSSVKHIPKFTVHLSIWCWMKSLCFAKGWLFWEIISLQNADILSHGHSNCMTSLATLTISKFCYRVYSVNDKIVVHVYCLKYDVGLCIDQ